MPVQGMVPFAKAWHPDCAAAEFADHVQPTLALLLPPAALASGRPHPASPPEFTQHSHPHWDIFSTDMHTTSVYSP